MNEIKIVKQIMEDQGASAAFLAEKLGKVNPDGKGQASYVSNRLQSKTMTVEKLLELLGALDCELIIRQKTGGKKSFVVINENRNPVKNYAKNKKAGEK